MANLLVPDLVAYQGPGTTYSGPTVGPLQNAEPRRTRGRADGGPIDVFSVFDALAITNDWSGYSRGAVPTSVVNSQLDAPVLGVAGRSLATGSVNQSSQALALGAASIPTEAVPTSRLSVSLGGTPASVNARSQYASWSLAQPTLSFGDKGASRPSVTILGAGPREKAVRLRSQHRAGRPMVLDSVLDDLAADFVLSQVGQPAEFQAKGPPRLPRYSVAAAEPDSNGQPADSGARLAVALLVAGFSGYRTVKSAHWTCGFQEFVSRPFRGC